MSELKNSPFHIKVLAEGSWLFLQFRGLGETKWGYLLLSGKEFIFFDNSTDCNGGVLSFSRSANMFLVDEKDTFGVDLVDEKKDMFGVVNE